MPQRTATADPLLIEHLAAWFGFSALERKLAGTELYPPYLYVGTVIFVNIAFGTAYRYWQTGIIGFVENPFGLALPLGVAIATVGITYMHGAQSTAEKAILDKNQVQDGFAKFRSTFSLRTKLLVYVVVVVAYLLYEVFVIGIGTLLQSQGLVLGVFYNLLVLPLCYIAVGVEFLLVYVSVHFLLPRKLAHSNLKLFFFDTRDMGGFQPIGDLFKKSYYIYTAGLLVYLAFFYGPIVVTGGPTGGAVQAGSIIAGLFTVLWLLGIGTLSYSIYQTHRIMAREKEDRLDEVESKLESVVTDPYESEAPEIDDPKRLEAIQFQLDQIKNTSEYPTTFTMWTQIAVSVILPQALQMSLQYF